MPREILTWRILGNNLVGTLHVPDPAPVEGGPLARSVGVLLLNAGPAPRAGNSDLSVHIGDHLAARGVPVFRFDLPGLGDSSGQVPEDINSFWLDVLRGRNDESTLMLVREIRRRFNLSAVILGGLCAAAVPTLRVADFDDSGVAGVILLEPQFRMTEPAPTRAAPGRRPRPKRRAKLSRALSSREWLYALTGEGRLASAAQPLRPLLLRALRRTTGHTLPKDANVPLVMRWRGCLARGEPSLVVVALGPINDRYVTRIVESLPATGRALNTFLRVPESNHILTTGPARDVVLRAIEQWMRQHFPVAPGRSLPATGAAAPPRRRATA